MTDIRRWVAYVIHPDTPLWRAANGECEFDDVVEQSRELEHVVREVDKRRFAGDVGPSEIARISREWDRLKQKLGVNFR